MRVSMIPFIDLKSQYAAIKGEVDRNIHSVLAHGHYIMGPEVGDMERALCEYNGATHCIAVASGTDALLISLMALGIGVGDEVITSPFTFAATAEAIVLVGATPVFVDIEADTCNLDHRLVEEAITPQTRAVIPVGLYGQPCDMDQINALAARHDLPVVDDAAQSFGSCYGKRKTGSLATLSCTSFFPSKPLGCYGDGGAIFTDDAALARACREIRVHGQAARYVHTRIGVGGRMDTIQCAVILAKLTRFQWEIERRKVIGARYNELLDAAAIKRVVQRTNRSSVFAQYTVFVPDRTAVQRRLEVAGIPTAVHYPCPLNRQPAYADRSRGKATPNSDQAAAQVMSLPMHADLSVTEQDAIVAALVEALQTS